MILIFYSSFFLGGGGLNLKKTFLIHVYIFRSNYKTDFIFKKKFGGSFGYKDIELKKNRMA